MARTGENIYHRKDKRWEGRYIYARDADGKALYRYVYAKTYAEVRQKLRTASSLQLQPITEPPLSEAFSNLISAWLENARLRVKASTYARYRNLTEKHIVPRLGKLAAKAVTTRVLEEYAGWMLENGRLDGNGGLSSNSAEDIFIVIKSVFRFAKIEHQIDWPRLRLKKEKPEIRVLTRQEQERLNAVLLDEPDNMKLGVLLSLYTGIRVGELCALRWENINLAERTLRVQNTLQRIQDDSGGTKIVITPPKSHHSSRIIPLPEFLIEIICSQASAPSWNSFEESSLYVSQDSMRSFAFFLSSIAAGASSNVAAQGIVAASALIIFVPNLIIFIAMQSKVLNTMAHSGIK